MHSVLGVCQLASSTSSTSFVFISDLHVGSTKAICSPEPILGEAQGSYKPNEFQKKLYNGWLKLFDQIQQPKRVRALFINGEVGDGVSPKKPYFQQWSIDPFDQLFDGSVILKPYIDIADDVFVVKGSDYHSSPDRTSINYDEIFARLAGATGYRSSVFKEHNITDDASLRNQFVKNNNNLFNRDFKSRQKFPVKGWDQLTDAFFLGKFYNKAVVVSHHIPHSKVFSYRATPLAKNSMLFALEKDRWFVEPYDSVLHAAGHVHYTLSISYPNEDSFTSGCWKAADNHLLKQGVGGTTVHYGIVECVIESNGHVDIWKHTLKGSDYPKPPVYDLTPITAKAKSLTPLLKRTIKK
jgi:hypothetical protein